ncbi:hypothetical protein, partial [Marinobacter sp.]|uniref:hypothetical protein n=1 Tax=Marinobacter sp. TaxID=50741 RepID=UPI0035C66648
RAFEPLLNQGRVFYIASPPCQPFIFNSFPLPKTAENPTGLLLVSRRAFYSESLPCQPLSEEF